MTACRIARWIAAVVVIGWSTVPTAASTANAVSTGSHPTSRMGDWMTESGQREAWLGFAVGAAGDVNGDGYDDVIVGAYRWTKGEATREGRAWTFYGSATGLSADPDWTADGLGQWAYFGHSVATAGDVNGDGYDDVIVGAYGYSSSTGRAYVYEGSASGLSSTATTTLTGGASTYYFGYSVAGAGDGPGDLLRDGEGGRGLGPAGERGEQHDLARCGHVLGGVALVGGEDVAAQEPDHRVTPRTRGPVVGGEPGA